MARIFEAAIVILIILCSAYCNEIQAQENNCFVLGIHEPNSNIYDGPTFCENISLPYITVRGPLQMHHTRIDGLVTVSGPFKSNSSFLNNIEIEPQIEAVSVILKNHTIVNGNIKFKGNKGHVYLENSIIHGKIINGSVNRLDRK